MNFKALAAATLLLATGLTVAPEAKAANACPNYEAQYNHLQEKIDAFNVIGGHHPWAQQQFAIRDKARNAGCPVGPDAIEIGVSATVHNPLGARQAAMNKLCTLWDQAEYIGNTEDGTPHFPFRYFRHADGTVTGVERKSQTTCLKLVKGVTITSTTTDNVFLVNQDGVKIGTDVNRAAEVLGSDRQFHNAWTFNHHN